MPIWLVTPLHHHIYGGRSTRDVTPALTTGIVYTYTDLHLHSSSSILHRVGEDNNKYFEPLHAPKPPNDPPNVCPPHASWRATKRNMVQLEYLQRGALRCNDDDNELDAFAASTPGRGYLPFSTTSTRRTSLTRQTWGFLWPAASVLRGSMNVANNIVATVRDGLTEEQRRAQAKKEEMRQILSLRMKNADTLEQWQKAAKELDILEDNEDWKQEPTSSEFDAELIEARLKHLDHARTNCDVKLMLYLVRTALSRDLGGMGNIRLYKHSHIGTKDLIERYIDSTLDTVDALVETSKHTLPDGLETKDILEQVVYARQAFGRSALLLSGGATFGMNHVGVLKALYEAKLLPRIISGASAGSIVCAVLCTRTDEEIPGVLADFPYGDLAVFEEDGREDGMLERLQRLLTQGAWIDIKHLTRVMQEILGDMTFQDSYNRTRRILNICVSSASVYELPRLLNYVTSPNVMIWSAVAASCSVPLLFSAGQLLVKNPITGEHAPWNPSPQHWVDGSVDNDLPMTRLAEMFNVNHFIVSQVNPHVVPFLIKDDEAITKDANLDGDTGPGWVYTLTNLAKDEALHRMQVLAELGVFPNMVSKLRSVLSQKYSGDITILPEIDYKDFPLMLKNPSPSFILKACLCGERATWPRLSRIRNHCAVELELDAAVQKLRARVVFSPSQVDLRRMNTGSFQNPSKRFGRKRRDSGSAVQALETLPVAVDRPSSQKAPKILSRPLLKASHSHWSVSRRYIPPLVSAGPRSEHTSPFPSPRPEDIQPFKFPSTKRAPELHLAVPDLSSAGETSQSPFGSDADIDSHTDESSPETEASEETVEGLGFHYSTHIQRNSAPGVIDFFSSSQPVTARTDHVLATSPASPRSNNRLTLSPTAITPMERSKLGQSKTEPSSPEFLYRRMFRSQSQTKLAQ
ncbi:Lipase [Lachnellula occidentalis]|uniref:Lipase n=1 Tax=Lachnellula occidentalis TaxID=215460 RepID=A0A8H8UFR8_9HELO|nr:Lipase [Lachnellula occidentalis]